MISYCNSVDNNVEIWILNHISCCTFLKIIHPFKSLLSKFINYCIWNHQLNCNLGLQFDAKSQDTATDNSLRLQNPWERHAKARHLHFLHRSAAVQRVTDGVSGRCSNSSCSVMWQEDPAGRCSLGQWDRLQRNTWISTAGG